MRDIIVRLASMKLAELEFKVEIEYSVGRVRVDRHHRSTLKSIPRHINSVLDKWVIAEMTSTLYDSNLTVDFLDENGVEHIFVRIIKPSNISDKVFMSLLKSIGLEAGTKQIKGNYRLASMKLAELKFKVEIQYSDGFGDWVDRHHRSTLKSIPRHINNVLDKWVIAEMTSTLYG
jgi:hypothetical protein